MNDEKIHFLEEAARSRRLAARINEPEAVARLFKLAEEYESKAAKKVIPPMSLLRIWMRPARTQYVLSLLLSRRVAAAIHPAHTLGALLVPRLLLSTLVTDDTLVIAVLVVMTASRLRRFSLLLFALLHQQLIAEHLPDDLFGLGFGLLLELAHGWPPHNENGAGGPMFPPIGPKPLTERGCLCLVAALEARFRTM
jgi:hypothetical protein